MRLNQKSVSSCLFGPVPSRRLGLSLGIDLILPKTCSFDCVYCECGKTTEKTLERRVFLPTSQFIKEFEDYLQKDYLKNPPDFFTFSGVGEPTLALNLGEVIQFIVSKKLNTKLALITNSSLFFDQALRQEILSADLVMPSLDSVLEESFQKINRPEKGVSVEKIIQGLIDFRKEYSGKISLEVFIIPEINTSKKELDLFKETLLQINPDEIQLNSLDRPGTESNVEKASLALLEQIKNYWNLKNTTIVSQYQYRLQKNEILNQDELKNKILSYLTRRPASFNDLKESFGNPDFLMSLLKEMMESKEIKTILMERGFFYVLSDFS